MTQAQVSFSGSRHKKPIVPRPHVPFPLDSIHCFAFLPPARPNLDNTPLACHSYLLQTTFPPPFCRTRSPPPTVFFPPAQRFLPFPPPPPFQRLRHFFFFSRVATGCTRHPTTFPPPPSGVLYHPLFPPFIFFPTFKIGIAFTSDDLVCPTPPKRILLPFLFLTPPPVLMSGHVSFFPRRPPVRLPPPPTFFNPVLACSIPS